MMTRPTYARSIALAVLLALSPGSHGTAEEVVHHVESASIAAAASHAVRLAPDVDRLISAPLEDFLPGVVLSLRHRAQAQRVDEQRLYRVSATGSNGVPEAALRAYHNAEGAMSGIDAGCRLPWTLLAAVGRVESDHGRHGAVLGIDGVSRPAIRGPQLDGSGPFAAISDSDGGRLDGDREWDRAVGAMQFLPGTWAMVASDGDGDGKADPNDIDDAALGSARYLCLGGHSMADPAGMAEALFRYNQSDYYVLLVMSYERGYRSGVFAVPSPPAPTEPTAVTRAPRRPRADPAQVRTSSPAAGSPTPAPSPTPRPSTRHSVKPAPVVATPAPSPTPAPAPTLVTVHGQWTACGSGWCLDTRPLDLGDAAQLDRTAPADLDGDGVTETNREEYAGLVGLELELRVRSGVEPLLVHTIAGHAVRTADGTFVG